MSRIFLAVSQAIRDFANPTGPFLRRVNPVVRPALPGRFD